MKSTKSILSIFLLSVLFTTSCSGTSRNIVKEEEFKIPEFNSLSEKEQWIKFQVERVDLEYDTTVRLERLMDCNNIAVSFNDSKVSVDQKYKNMERIFNAYWQENMQFIEAYKNQRHRYSVLGYELPELILDEHLGYGDDVDIQLIGLRNLRFTEKPIPQDSNYLDVKSYTFKNIDSCVVVSTITSLQDYKRYLTYAYENIDDMKEKIKQEKEEMRKVEAEIKKSEEANRSNLKTILPNDEKKQREYAKQQQEYAKQEKNEEQKRQQKLKAKY